MNSFELIERYLPKAIDKYFFEDAKTAILEQGSKFIDVKFDQTGYVKIASILMDGLSDYYQTQVNSEGYLSPANARPSDPANYAAYAGNVASGSRDGFALGGTTVQWEIFRLQYVRGKQFRIDYISDEETAGIIIGNAVEEFNRTKVIPEVDVCRFSLIAGKANASLGNLVSLAVDAADAQSSGDYINTKNGPTGVIHRFNEAFEWLTEHEVPEEEQVMFVSPTIMTMIRNTPELNKFLTQGDFRSPAGLDFTVEKYGGRPIIVVPSNRFFTNVLLTQNGYRAQSGSKVINFMVVSTKAVVPVRKLEWSKIYGPEQSGLAGFHGYLINYLLYHGVVIPRNKVPGVYVCASNTDATAKANTLQVSTVAGASQYHWMVNEYWTSPAGLRGRLCYNKSAAFTLGATGIVPGTTANVNLCEPGMDISEAAGSITAYFGLIDDAGTVIATSGASAISVTQHA